MTERPSPPAGNSLSRLWRGEVPLFTAFWTWAVLGALLVNITSSVAFLALIAYDQPVLAIIAGYAPSLPYNLLVTVGVWRSAARYPGKRHWAELARVAIVAGMILLSLT